MSESICSIKGTLIIDGKEVVYENERVIVDDDLLKRILSGETDGLWCLIDLPEEASPDVSWKGSVTVEKKPYSG